MNSINELVEMKNALTSEETSLNVASAQIHNPTRELTSTLSSYLSNRFEKLEKNDQFLDFIKVVMKERVSEADFDQLLQMYQIVSTSNNKAADDVLRLFKNEQSGKTVLESIKDNDVSTTAARLYQQAEDPKILQALTYFGQILGKIDDKSQPTEQE